jgi:hypothetical protein
MGSEALSVVRCQLSVWAGVWSWVGCGLCGEQDVGAAAIPGFQRNIN